MWKDLCIVVVSELMHSYFFIDPIYQAWLQENKVLSFALRGPLHHAGYIVKLENVIRLMSKERTLTSDDLNDILVADHPKVTVRRDHVPVIVTDFHLN